MFFDVRAVVNLLFFKKDNTHKREREKFFVVGKSKSLFRPLSI